MTANGTVTNDQPMPTPGRTDITPIVRQRFLDTLDHQENAGIATYGVTLQTHNGRDMGRDAWEEIVDHMKYLTGLEIELVDALREIERLRALVISLGGTP